MLKAFCDCVAAGVREERDVYGTQLNGNSLRAPLCSEEKMEKENVFLLPRKLNDGDKIIASLTSNDPKLVSIGLITGCPYPDYGNVAGQLELHFPSNNEDTDKGKIVFKRIVNGLPEEDKDEDQYPTHLVPDYHGTAHFSVTIGFKDNEVTFFVGQSETYSKNLEHNLDSVRYIMVDGVVKVNKLEFEFS